MRALLVALGIVFALWLLVVAVLMLLGKRTHARELAALLPNLIKLFRGLIEDERVPRGSKWLLGLAALWVASPIDLLPEFIPFLGPLDDVVIAALVLRHLVRRAGPDVVRDHWHGGDQSLRLILRVAGSPDPDEPS